VKRLLLFMRLVIINGRKVEVAVADTVIDEEIVRLTKRVPRTAAEKEFHKWLLEWKREARQR